MSGLGALSLLSGEALLSLYPVLTRTVNDTVPLSQQIVIRLAVAVVICYPFISVSVGSILSQPSLIAISLLYVVHILVSYLAFLNLEVGVAMTLFYTYPIINLLIHQLVIAKQINMTVIWYFVISFLGAVIIMCESFAPTHRDEAPPKSIPFGIMAILLAAVTESLIYVFYKTGDDTNPFNMLFSLCLAGTILGGVYLLWGASLSPEGGSEASFAPRQVRSTSPISPPEGEEMGSEASFAPPLEQVPVSLLKNPIVILVIANILLGVVGYLLRFYSVSRLTTELFSILSFSSIIFGYIYGWFYYGETINMSKLVGTGLIMYSVYKVKMMGF